MELFEVRLLMSVLKWSIFGYNFKLRCDMKFVQIIFNGMKYMLWYYLMHVIGIYQCIPDLKSIILVEIILLIDFSYGVEVLVLNWSK